MFTAIPRASVTSKCDSAFLSMNGIDNCPSLLPATEIDGSYLHSAFLRTAARDPGLPAVLLDDGEAVTYGQLNARSDCLAHRLQQAGVMAESVVGIALRPGVEMATALLAVLKSGGAYLPLDPTAPLDRSCMILQDAGAVLLLGAGSSPWCEEALPCDYLDIEMDSADSASLTGTSPVEMDLDPRNLAYVIYTSGSTGRPKGVMVPHKSIAAVFEWRRRAFPFFQEDRILQTMSYTFDASLWQFFHTWGSGAGLVFLTPEERRDPNRIVEMIGEFRITVLGVPPSVWKLLLDHRDIGKCDSLRMGFCGGNRCLRRYVSVSSTGWECRSTMSTDLRKPPWRPLPGRRTFRIGTSRSVSDGPSMVPGRMCWATTWRRFPRASRVNFSSVESVWDEDISTIPQRPQNALFQIHSANPGAGCTGPVTESGS